ncbi:MAG: N-acetylmuramoyl-L-alanine amidase family protein, partial [Oscillospiraceae bacterium]
MTPQFVVIHNTANDASAEAEIAYMCRNNNEVSFHYAVDDVEAVQGIPENRNGWHAGDGGSGRGNRYGIAIEICYSKSGGPRFDQAEKNAAELTADILRRYGWGIDKVTKHQDYSGKYCPHRTLDRGWQRYLDMVSAALGAGSAAPDTSAPSAAGYKVGDTVIVTGYPCATAAGEKPGARLTAYRGKITKVHGSGT